MVTQVYYFVAYRCEVEPVILEEENYFQVFGNMGKIRT
jgi:hypothetical protein